MERTLLLVDDDEDIGAALKRLLRLEGYNILCARSGQEGLELLANNQVQVIVSDQRMPEMTGVEFLTRVKELYPKTVRIILSGYADLSSVTEAINQGAIYKFLTKPWDNESLCTNVLEAFRHYELTQQRNHLALEIQEANTTLASLSLELSKLLEQKDNQIAHITKYDQLTNLPNRLLFLDNLNRLLAQAASLGQQVALFFIDLDEFSLINDTYGYAEGDKLLQTVAKKLADYVVENAMFARTGDDEFGLILTNITSSNDAVKISRLMLDSFGRETFNIGGKEIKVGISIGLCIFPTDGQDSSSLFRAASSALRSAKVKGQSYVIHSAE
jgi:diguanylate cyclase (GGDEF)-like protein